MEPSQVERGEGGRRQTQRERERERERERALVDAFTLKWMNSYRQPGLSTRDKLVNQPPLFSSHLEPPTHRSTKGNINDPKLNHTL